MLITYTLTVRLLAQQRQNLGGGGMKSGSGWSSGWLGIAPPLGNEKKKTSIKPFLLSEI